MYDSSLNDNVSSGRNFIVRLAGLLMRVTSATALLLHRQVQRFRSEEKNRDDACNDEIGHELKGCFLLLTAGALGAAEVGLNQDAESVEKLLEGERCSHSVARDFHSLSKETGLLIRGQLHMHRPL